MRARPDGQEDRMNIKDEDLAAMVALRLDRTPAQCAAWIESADRVCGRDAARPWLCKRHEGVAARRLAKALAEQKERAEKSRAAREERRRKDRARLEEVEATLDRLDPLRDGTAADRAAACAPLSQRLPSDSRIAKLARLHDEADRLRARLGTSS